jgi:hypothetical protein
LDRGAVARGDEQMRSAGRDHPGGLRRELCWQEAKRRGKRRRRNLAGDRSRVLVHRDLQSVIGVATNGEITQTSTKLLGEVTGRDAP